MDTAANKAAFDKGLGKIENIIVQMGGLVERQIIAAFDALHKRDVDAALIIVENDKVIDGLHRDLDERIMRLLAVSNSDPSDLRMVIGALKVSASLERIGDRLLAR